MSKPSWKSIQYIRRAAGDDPIEENGFACNGTGNTKDEAIYVKHSNILKSHRTETMKRNLVILDAVDNKLDQDCREEGVTPTLTGRLKTKNALSPTRSEMHATSFNKDRQSLTAHSTNEFWTSALPVVRDILRITITEILHVGTAIVRTATVSCFDQERDIEMEDELEFVNTPRHAKTGLQYIVEGIPLSDSLLISPGKNDSPLGFGFLAGSYFNERIAALKRSQEVIWSTFQSPRASHVGKPSTEESRSTTSSTAVSVHKMPQYEDFPKNRLLKVQSSQLSQKAKTISPMQIPTTCHENKPLQLKVPRLSNKRKKESVLFTSQLIRNTRDPQITQIPRLKLPERTHDTIVAAQVSPATTGSLTPSPRSHRKKVPAPQRKALTERQPRARRKQRGILVHSKS